MGQSAAAAQQPPEAERPPEAGSPAGSPAKAVAGEAASQGTSARASTNPPDASPGTSARASPDPEDAPPRSVKVEPPGRLKTLLVSGAGLADVNGTYSLATPFAKAEVFIKESDHLGTIYVRRQAADLPSVWVITLSSEQRESRHLYRRDGAMVDRETPPLLGWQVYPSGDGKEKALESRLGEAPKRLEYHKARDKTLGVEVPGETKYQPDYFLTDADHSMQVCIVGASNLRTSEEEPEPYCVCAIEGKPGSEFQTPTRHASFNPTWKFMMEVEDFEENDVLMFSVKTDDTVLGVAALKHSRIYPSGFLGEVPLEIPEGSESKESTDEAANPIHEAPKSPPMMLSLCITPANKEVPGILCTVNKTKGNVGVGFVPEKRKNALSVRTIAEGGQVDRWNHDHPEQQIKVRDRVVAVNGKQGSCKEILSELAHAKGPLNMMVKRKLSF